MLQVINDNIIETSLTTTSVDATGQLNGGTFQYNVGSCYPYQYQTYWTNYPVYITTDKTKKAIEILKALQAEKLFECKSVNKFIELVEKISNIL